jgi:hypothetical protein
MSKKFNIVYLSLTPLIFGLSWFISHKLHLTYMQSSGVGVQPNRSLLYASVFSLLYVAAYVVIKDLYPNSKKD